MSKILFEDRLKGGVDVANLDKYLNRFDPKEVKMGVKDEKEHTNDPKIAAEIASDHLATEPHYYSKLKKAHIESIEVFEFNFFDILESDDDVPIGAAAKPLDLTKALPKKSVTPKPEPKKREPRVANTIKSKAPPGSEIRKADRLVQRERYKSEYLKMGKSPEEAEEILGASFDVSKDKGGRPRSGDPIRRQHRLNLFHGKDSNKLRVSSETDIPYRNILHGK